MIRFLQFVAEILITVASLIIALSIIIFVFPLASLRYKIMDLKARNSSK